jgi:ribosome-associated toxin RatA of RatAB toxin-antitoxin module
MPTIHLTSFIAAPVDRVFDLSRNVGLHKISLDHFGEQAVSGITSGFMNKDDSITWKGKHLFKVRYFTSKITEMKPFERFTEKMIKGDFKSFQHQHFFKPAENGTIVIDILNYETPYGLLGRMANKFYIHGYLESLIHHRNKVIRYYAEGDKWHALLSNR